MRLIDLAINHPYYCSDNNYYSPAPGTQWETMSDFLDEFGDADVDMNLVFRWDVHAPDEDETEYRANIFIMHQRKGIFAPHRIKSVTEDDVERLVTYLTKHLAHLSELWLPLQSGGQ